MALAQLIAKRKEFEAKQDKVGKVFHEAGPEIDLMKATGLNGADSKARLDEIRVLNLELEALGKEINDLVQLEEMAEKSKKLEDGKQAVKDYELPGGTKGSKTIGEQVVEDAKYKSYNGGKVKFVFDGIGMKTLMTTAAGFAPESLRTGEVVQYVRRQPNIFQIIPKGQTNSAAILFMEQTTRTNNAAEKAEGASTYGEAALVWTERSQTVEDVGVWIPVTTQQLEDVPAMQGIINDELGQMLVERIDYQIINGSGSTPSLQGILNKSGIQSMAHSGNKFDTIFRAGKNIRVIGGANPNILIIHPNDWQDIRLAKTEAGQYILGNPTDTGPDQIWGMVKIESTAISENTALAGDFSPAWIKLYEKRGIIIEITDSHDTYFIIGKYAIRATVRVAVVIKRAAAFCEITNI